MRLGTDIVQVSRLAVEVEQLGADLLDRIFTSAEQRRCGGRIESLAARWAAKEAAIKALGWQLQDVDLRTIEVIGSDRPAIVLHGTSETVLAVSLAHDGDYAIAVVVAG
ncbi:MAG: 4'-phosphopantetheinyl transferase superfamily protein [Candidatus Nanopelagicales bacterium]